MILLIKHFWRHIDVKKNCQYNRSSIIPRLIILFCPLVREQADLLDELDEICSVASTTKSNRSRMIVITEGEVNKIEVISEEDEEIECAQDVQDLIWGILNIFVSVFLKCLFPTTTPRKKV